MEAFMLMFMLVLVYTGKVHSTTPVAIPTNNGTITLTPPPSTEISSTQRDTTFAGITGSETPAPLIPRFLVKTANGDVCMILQFNATIELKYLTTDYDHRSSTLPITDAADYAGSCEGGGPRNFTLWYPSKDRFCVTWTLSFPEVTSTTYVNNNKVTVHVTDPCFESDALAYNHTIELGTQNPEYEGTIGKTFECDLLESNTLNLLLMITHVMLQPFADRSSDKGHFGDVETCPNATSPQPSYPSTTRAPFPTFPSPFDTGKIVAIVLGSVGVVMSILVLIAAVVRKRKKSKRPYATFN